MIETQDREHEERYKHRWYGKYRAFVRDNNDHERLGRCRLEIPAVLGQGRENWSDWAWPCFPYGGNEDTGMFLIPEEGASVWAEFEGGQVQYPIWAGVWLAGSNPREQPEESKRLCFNPTCHDCADRVEHQPDRRDDLEHKKHHGHPPYYCPRRKVLLKTETGHTIMFDDRDEEEFLKIIDRAGQIIHMDCPVKRDVQAGNALRRGTRDADQPQAIEELIAGLRRGDRYQTLLGATGSGKTFTIANVVEDVGGPTLVLAHNKTLAAQLCSELKEFFPENSVEYFVSYYDYYQPEAYIPRSDTYIAKDADINDEIDKLRHAATRSLFSRRDVIIVASVSCIYGLGEPSDYQQFIWGCGLGSGWTGATCCAAWWRCSTSGTTRTWCGGASGCGGTRSRSCRATTSWRSASTSGTTKWSASASSIR